MGGGVAMRAAAKVVGLGVLNVGLRGGPPGEVSAARRSVAAVVSSSSSSSSSDDVKLAIANNVSNTNSSVEKPYYEDWEFEDMEPGGPMPRLVFGGAPTIQEAKQATSDLNDALQQTYLSSNGQLLFDLEHVETKPCLVTQTCVTPIASKHAIQAFRYLHENADAQNVVASIASDPNVWDAVLKNEALVDFLQTHKTGVVVSPEVNVNDESTEASESKTASGKGFMGYVKDIKQKITVIVVDMMTSLSDTFQSLFGGSAKDEYAMNADGTAGISVEKATIGAALMGLAIMVITVVVLKRA